MTDLQCQKLLQSLLIAFFTLNFRVLAETFYVKPNLPNTQKCLDLKNDVPCFTLSHYAKQPASYFTSHTTLLLLPGNHTLESELTFNNITSLTVSSHLQSGSNNSETSGVLITCNKEGTFNFQSIEQLQMSGLNLKGCMNNEILFVNHFTLEDCSFRGDWGAGTSLNLKFVTDINILRSSFYSNFGSETIDLYGEVISGGGALIVIGGENLTISSSTFHDNTANAYEHTNVPVYGGAIHVATLYLSNTTISVNIEHSTFVNNTVIPNSFDAEGGAIYIYGATLTINNSTFSNNSVSEGVVGKGGGIGIHSSTVTIEDTEFSGNNVNVYRKGYGGAMYVDDNSVVTVTRCTFDGNFITSGEYGEAGAIEISYGFIALQSSTFTGNRIVSNTTVGGAVFAEFTILIVNDSTFLQNSLAPSSFGYGGAIYTSNCTVLFTRAEFVNNSIYGGIVGISSWGGSTLVTESRLFAEHSVFDSNMVRGNLARGGALVMEESIISLSNCLFVNNVASFDTEIEMNDLESSNVLNMSNVSTVDVYGGAIVTTNFDTVKIDDSTFKMNHVIASGDGGGGAISAFSVERLTISNSLFVKNDVISGVDGGGGALNIDTGNIEISYSTFQENSVTTNINGYGGAVYAKASYSESSTVSIVTTEVTFIGNTVSSVKHGYGGGLTVEGGILTLDGDTIFTSNLATGNDYGGGGGVFLMQTELNARNCSFNNNIAQGNLGKGGGMSATGSIVSIIDSNFKNNSARGQLAEGGAVFGDWVFSLEVEMCTCTFEANEAIGFNSTGGAVTLIPPNESVEGYNQQQTVVAINNSSFLGNRAFPKFLGEGGALMANSVRITLKNTLFVNNSVYSHRKSIAGGGAMSVLNSTLVIVESDFFNNFIHAEGGKGGAICALASDVVLNGTTFTGNFLRGGQFIRQGGVFYFESANITSVNFLKIISNNHIEVPNEGIVFALHSNLILSDITTVLNNTGSLFAFASNVTFHGVTNIMNNSFVYDNAETLQSGGAVTAFQSKIVFTGDVNLLYNAANRGGAILASETKIYTYDNLTIAHNTALILGGGIYAYQSELNFEGSTIISDNTASLVGGGIDAVGSTAKFSKGTLRFSNNLAQEGGAFHLEQNSKLYINKPDFECLPTVSKFCIKPDNWLRLEFTENSAERGGAIFVTDDTNSGTCKASPKHRQTITSRECFFQTLGLYSGGQLNINLINTFFTNNSATIAGGNIYGGLLDRCIVSPLSEIIKLIPFHKDILYTSSSVKYILNTTNIQPQELHSPSKLSSDAVRVCFCQRNNQPDCSYRPPAKYVKKGEMFSVSLVAVDQFNNTISNTNIHATLSLNATLAEGQSIQRTSSNGGCTSLHYSVLSPRESEELVLFAEGPCSDLGISASTVTVRIAPCSIGFVDTGIKCDCDPILKPEFVANCSVDKEAVLRNGDVWVMYENTSDYEGYILHKHCPFDYCRPITESVYVNLNIEDGSDALCAFNRSRKLCGSCKEGLSVVFGSSRCLRCSNAWLALVIVFAIAGLALMFILLILNLTVAVGTLNGLIFYANVIAAYQSTFLPFDKPNPATVFIAWLNLDLGFETCFFDGMDDYVKVWLQIAFPLYIIFLVVMVIFVAENSTKFTRILRLTSTNPIALLATLILLSYAKFIRIIIAAFSSASLNYVADGFQEVVWLVDGNLGYGQGKHIPLFITALVILLICLTYTLLLLLWSCTCPRLVKKRLTKVVSWIKSSFTCPQFCQTIMRACKCNSEEFNWFKRSKTRLNDFIKVYEDPYTPKHCYWSGLLLLARIILYLFSALNIIDDPNLNLIFIIFNVGAIQLWSKLAGRIYKRWIYDAIESAYFFNLITFALLTLYFRATNRQQAALAYTSISVAFLTFLATVVYHGYEFVYKTARERIKENGCVICLRLQHSTSETARILPAGDSELDIFIEEFPEEQNGSITEFDANPSQEDTQIDSGIICEEHTASDSMTIDTIQTSDDNEEGDNTQQNQMPFENVLEFEELIDFQTPSDHGRQMSNRNANAATNSTSIRDNTTTTVVELTDFVE